jgi:rhodanese-related sulfurtransferase
MLATVFNFQSPSGIPLRIAPRPAGAISIHVDEALRLVSEENALIVDARPRELFNQAHAKDALNIPPALFDSVYQARFWEEDLERPLVIYGKTFSRLYDETVARRFLSRDHEKVYLIDEDPKSLLVVSGGDN